MKAVLKAVALTPAIKESYLLGYSVQEIAEAFKLGQTVIRRRLSLSGVPMRSRGRRHRTDKPIKALEGLEEENFGL